MTRPAHLQLSSSSAFLDWFNHKDDDQDNDKATNWIALFTMHYKPSWSGIKDLTKKSSLPLQICPKYHIYTTIPICLWKNYHPDPPKKDWGNVVFSYCLLFWPSLSTTHVSIFNQVKTSPHMLSSSHFHAESVAQHTDDPHWLLCKSSSFFLVLRICPLQSFSYVEGFYMCHQLWTQQVATANEHFANEHFADEHSNCAHNLHQWLFFHIPPPAPLTAEQTEKRLGTTYLPRSRV